MPAYRFFLNEPFVTHKSYELERSESAHIKVMRLKEGDTLELVNGLGQLAQGELQGKTHVKLLEVSEEKPTRHVIICQAIPKINRIDIIVEKGTELGMTHLWLFPGVKSEKKQVGESRLKRLRTISISSMKQCGRLHLPLIEEKPPLTAWDTLPHQAYFGSLAPSAPTFRRPQDDLCFFVGPEAGFSKEEEQTLTNLGATGVKLGSHILRTDTAPLVALSLIQA